MPPRERQNWREDKISRKGTKNDDENYQHGGENDENDEHGGEDDFDEVKLEDGGVVEMMTRIMMVVGMVSFACKRLHFKLG